jgi:ParB-like chromosome segregation protein Spo0J
LSLLVKQKRLAKTTPIPCIVRDAASDILAEDDSLAENTQRVALHPLDQFRAFVALRGKGQSDAEIAAAFFVTPQIVKQRLKLASVAPALLEVYAEDGMTLEQLMAFSVNPDHARQAQVWDAVKNSWNKEPYAIRRTLTETSVRASDRRAVFVGVEAYEAAGGTMLRDLFQGDDGGWLEDPALLDRLVTEKLQAEAETVAGWKWIERALDLPYGYSHSLRSLSGDPAPMTDDEGAAHAKLLAEYRALKEEYAGQGDDSNLGDGQTSAAHGRTFIMSGGQPIGADLPEDEDDGAPKPLPERLVMELTAHRTLALREAIGRSPDVALTLLLLKLVTDTFRTSSASGSCLEASVRHAEWEADLPLGANALHEKVNPYGAGISAGGLTRRMAHADLVVRATGLDMVEAGWEPTVDTYLNRVPKVRILEAVREAKGEGTAQLLDHLKKGEMASEAERLLKGRGWMPKWLTASVKLTFLHS